MSGLSFTNDPVNGGAGVGSGSGWDGAAAAAGGIGGALINYYGNRQIAREAQAYELRMWNLMNQYNTPQSQMQRLIDAGLNPNLMYGQGNVGNASAPPKAHVPELPNIGQSAALGLSMLGQYIGFKKDQAMIDNLQTNRDLTLAKIQSESTKNLLMLSNKKYKDFQLFSGQTLLPGQKGSLESSIAKKRFDVEKGKKFLGIDYATKEFNLSKGMRLLPYQQELLKQNVANAAILESLRRKDLLLRDAQIGKIGTEQRLKQVELNLASGLAKYGQTTRDPYMYRIFSLFDRYRPTAERNPRSRYFYGAKGSW